MQSLNNTLWNNIELEDMESRDEYAASCFCFSCVHCFVECFCLSIMP